MRTFSTTPSGTAHAISSRSLCARHGAGACRRETAAPIVLDARTHAHALSWAAVHSSRQACRRVRVHGVSEGSAAEAGAPAAVAAGPLRVELDTRGARGSIRFDVAPMGFGQAIVVVDVADNSEAQEAGVRPGMRLTAISDPIRPLEVWKLQDRPSLKNIRELLRMRSADTITLEFEKWDGPMPGVLDGDSLSATSGPSSAGGSSMVSPFDSMDGSSQGGVPGESIGDRLARQYREAAASGRAPTAVEQRMKRRKERLEVDAQRDDRPFLLGVLAMFVLPPLIILLVAQSSGYLDQLYFNTLTGMK